MNIKNAVKLLAAALMVFVLFGATTTRTASSGKVDDFAWVKFNAVNIAGTDTAIFVMPSPPDFPQKSTLYDTSFQVTISTQSANGDSVDVGVRFQSSFDGVSWETFTIGTDSTSWVSTTTTTWDLNATQFLGYAAYGGRKPYNRFMVVGITGNAAGTAGDGFTAVKIDAVGFD